MPEWLTEAFQGDADVRLALLAPRLAVALALGCVVAGVYRLTHGRRGEPAAGLTATLVMLTVLIALVTMVIGNNTARAFSLVGVLAIVRFRTVVEDTRDTAFVIFAVAVGMAVGAGFLKGALVGLPFAAAAAFLFRPPQSGRPGPAEYTLALRVGTGHDPEALVREPFGKHLERCRLVALGTARSGAALDLTYAVRLRREEAAAAFVAELNGLEGVQGVELRQA
jgi:uncharacterized membrane protein YhiD involved in acid resistance